MIQRLNNETDSDTKKKEYKKPFLSTIFFLKFQNLKKEKVMAELNQEDTMDKWTYATYFQNKDWKEKSFEKCYEIYKNVTFFFLNKISLII